MRYIATDTKHRVLFGTLAATRAMTEHLAKTHYGCFHFYIYPERMVAEAWKKK